MSSLSKVSLTAAFAISTTLAAATGPDEYHRRGIEHFRAGRIQESIADFDRYLELRPDAEPYHWQRGISYYYAGEFAKGVRQFESHRTVNPQDVENAIWHYLCKARVDGVDQARKGLIEIQRDRRPWAMQVYAMFQGKVTPDQVLEHARKVSQSETARRDNLFYAHLYIGLFYEAAGESQKALRHVKIAAEQFPSKHYMGDVARVHVKLRSRALPAAGRPAGD